MLAMTAATRGQTSSVSTMVGSTKNDGSNGNRSLHRRGRTARQRLALDSEREIRPSQGTARRRGDSPQHSRERARTAPGIRAPRAPPTSVKEGVSPRRRSRRPACPRRATRAASLDRRPTCTARSAGNTRRPASEIAHYPCRRGWTLVDPALTTRNDSCARLPRARGDETVIVLRIRFGITSAPPGRRTKLARAPTRKPTRHGPRHLPPIKPRKIRASTDSQQRVRRVE